VLELITQTAMAAFAAEEGDEPTTPHHSSAQGASHRRAALIRHQIHSQAATAPRPASTPIPESYYQYQQPSVNVAGPSRPPTRSGMNDRVELGHADTGGSRNTDPDRTYVQGNTSVDSSPVDSTHLAPGSDSGPASSPTVPVRSSNGAGRISRSPLRYRHDSSSASSSFALPSVPFEPSLPNIAHLPSQQSVLSLPQVTSVPIGIGSKRPITAVHLDPDLDVTMTDDGMTGVGIGRTGRASKRRNVDRKGDGEAGTGDGSGKDREREERKRGRKGKDTT
jgi:hypothetical protein